MNKLLKLITMMLVGVMTLNIFIPSVSATADTESIDSDIEIEVEGLTFTVSDSKSNESTTVIPDDETYQSGYLINEQDEQQYFEKDNLGNIFLDGELVYDFEEEFTQVEIEEDIITPYSWTLFNRFTTTQSIVDTTNNIVLGIISLLPGPVGTVAGIAAIINTAKSMGNDEVYIDLHQYHNAQYTRIRNITYYYANSNYSNLIDQITSEAPIY